jgi:hypothetical protein
MKDDRDVDAEYYLGAPKNERERDRSTHASHDEDPGTLRARKEDVAASPADSGEAVADITDATLRYGIVEEADDDLGEGLYARRAA